MAGQVEWDDFSEPKPHRNLALVIGERKFWVSKGALAEYSPVFSTMFFGDFQESTNNEVELREKDAEDILEMLRCLFPTSGVVKKLDYDNAARLSKLADEYQIAYLTRQCKEFLDSIMEGHDGLLKLFTEGVRLGQKNVIRASLPLVARFELTELQPILDNVPDPMRSALFYQQLSQTGHQANYDGVNLWRSSKCDLCHKLMIWNRTAYHSVPVSSQACCRCVAPFAAEELEKIGY